MLSKRRLQAALAIFAVLVYFGQISLSVTEEFIGKCPIVPVITVNNREFVEEISKSKDTGYQEISTKGTRNVEFSCLSQLPVDFHFKGQLPIFLVSSKTLRYSGTVSWDKPENFCYETVITVRTTIAATGEYTCSVIPKEGNGTTTLYLYSAGDAHESILGAGQVPQRTIQVEVTSNDTTVVIPCRVKNPNIVTTLEKDGVLLTSSDYEYYDPQMGYMIKIEYLSQTVGLYKCKVGSSSWDQVSVNVSISTVSKGSIDPIGSVPSITIKDERSFFCTNKGGVIGSFKYIKCLTPTECGVAESCLQNDKCYTEMGTECPPYLWQDPNTESCQRILKGYNSSAGVLRCDSDKSGQTLRFFTDFKGKLVNENSLVPLADTLKIAHINYYNWENMEIYAHENISMTCNASKFKFSIGFVWLFILQDHRVVKAPATEVPSSKTNSNDTYYSGTSEITINSTDIKKVVCMAPVLNSKTWENVSINLNIKNSYMPKFLDSMNQTKYFALGDENQRLSCEAHGQPPPIITWKRYNEEVNTNLSFSYKNTFANGSFNPRINVVGENGTVFVCNATNLRGSIFKYYTVYLRNKGDIPHTLPSYVIAVISTCVLLVVLMTAVLLRLCWKYNYVRLMKTDEQNFLKGEMPAQVIDGGTQTDLPPLSPYSIAAYDHDTYEVSESKLIKQEVIGEGQFGIVYRYLLKNPSGCTEVACKTIKDPTDVEAFKLLLEEIKILQYVGNHRNVIRLLGAVTKDIRKLHAFIIVEYCNFGNLQKYLIDHRSSFHSEISERGHFRINTCAQPMGNYVLIKYAMKTSDLIQWSYEIACGMHYLGQKSLIHRDVAARNIVLDKEKVAKITDFGLCKNLNKNTGKNKGKDYYRFVLGKSNPLLPLPWLAPEIVEGGICSINSDIWAYGVTLWEIFSLGEQPYPGKTHAEITNFLEDGNRMERPQYCNASIYNTMLDCWNQTPTKRPSFSKLKNIFATLQARMRECESASVGKSDGEENSDDEGSVDSDTNDTME